MRLVPIRAARVLGEHLSPAELRFTLSRLWDAAEADDLFTEEERVSIHAHIESLQRYTDRLIDWRDLT